MTGIELYSTTAASNNSTPPNGWPEGQAPSTVNDCGRQMMASIRTWYEDAQWINLGYTHTYVASTQFKVSGLDVTSIYSVGRRVKAVGSSTGTIFGTITVSAFSTDSTITIVWDSGSLSNEALTVSVGIISLTNGAGVTTPIASNAITNAKLAQMAAGTYKGNPTAATANASDNLIASTAAGQLQRSSSTQVTLMPYKGNQVLFPNGYVYTIGSSGLASGSINGGCNLNGSGSSTLVAATLYYCYLWYNAGTPALDFSATGHSTDATTGIEIKTGDATRVLVGMIYPTAGPVVVDSGANRLVASWHNRQDKDFANAFTANRTTNSTSFAEINTEIRCQFLTWGTRAEFSYSGVIGFAASNATYFNAITADGVSTFVAGPTGSIAGSGAAAPYPGDTSGKKTLSEGFHYVTVAGAVTSQTATWYQQANSVTSTGLTGSVNI